LRVLATKAANSGFTIPDDKLTPNGGAVAIGHPFGATGTRYVLTLATELAQRKPATAPSACASALAKAWPSF
jgi:acetyl-CoA acetyltransferase